MKACGRKHSDRLYFSLFCLASCTHPPKCLPCRSTLLSSHLWLNWVCPTITLTGLPEQPPSDVSAADSLHRSLHAADGASTQPASAPNGVSPTHGIKEKYPFPHHAPPASHPELPSDPFASGLSSHALCLKPSADMCLAKHCTTLQLLTQNATSSRKPLLTPACQ